VTQSNWEKLKPRTGYHFDPYKTDPAYDAMRYVGRFVGDWKDELEQAIESSKQVTWRTRNPKDGTSKDIDAEEYDLELIGADLNLALTNLEYNLAPVFQRMTDSLHLVPGNKREIQSRVHVQFPGQVWNLHIDKLEKYLPDDPNQVYRFMVMLNDWAPGHFLQYGNYVHTGYRAGEIYSFDWYNVPHCTANAGMIPRCTLLVTGVASSETVKLLAGYNTIIDIS
jgi:hypothetical protein